jgi:uncharacterized membrane protein YkoI
MSQQLVMISNSNRHVAVVGGGIVVALAIGALVMPVALREISAQETNTNTTQTSPMRTEIPQLNGSVNVEQQSNQFIQDNVRVPFATALQTAQTEVGNGTAISGNLGVVQGYLVYIFKLTNFDAQTSRLVIVDAGNGSVLYTSGDMPLFFGGLGCRGGGIGGGPGHHMGFFGNHRGNDHRGGGQTSADIINNGQPARNAIVVSPAVGV